MALYRVTAPNGKDYEIEGPAGASNALVVQALLAQYPDAAKKPPETTVLGQVGEAFKGLVPGAVGLVESWATGASWLPPGPGTYTSLKPAADGEGLMRWGAWL